MLHHLLLMLSAAQEVTLQGVFRREIYNVCAIETGDLRHTEKLELDRLGVESARNTQVLRVNLDNPVNILKARKQMALNRKLRAYVEIYESIEKILTSKEFASYTSAAGLGLSLVSLFRKFSLGGLAKKLICGGDILQSKESAEAHFRMKQYEIQQTCLQYQHLLDADNEEENPLFQIEKKYITKKQYLFTQKKHDLIYFMENGLIMAHNLTSSPTVQDSTLKCLLQVLDWPILKKTVSWRTASARLFNEEAYQHLFNEEAQRVAMTLLSRLCYTSVSKLPEARCIFHLSGAPATFKTTIVRTIANAACLPMYEKPSLQDSDLTEASTQGITYLRPDGEIGWWVLPFFTKNEDGETVLNPVLFIDEIDFKRASPALINFFKTYLTRKTVPVRYVHSGGSTDIYAQHMHVVFTSNSRIPRELLAIQDRMETFELKNVDQKKAELYITSQILRDFYETQLELNEEEIRRQINDKNLEVYLQFIKFVWASNQKNVVAVDQDSGSVSEETDSETLCEVRIGEDPARHRFTVRALKKTVEHVLCQEYLIRDGSLKREWVKHKISELKSNTELACLKKTESQKALHASKSKIRHIINEYQARIDTLTPLIQGRNDELLNQRQQQMQEAETKCEIARTSLSSLWRWQNNEKQQSELTAAEQIRDDLKKSISHLQQAKKDGQEMDKLQKQCQELTCFWAVLESIEEESLEPDHVLDLTPFTTYKTLKIRALRGNLCTL